MYIYNVNYFSGFIVSGAVYWALAWLVPININPNSTSKANNVDQDAGYVGSITVPGNPKRSVIVVPLCLFGISFRYRRSHG
jgi:hypothetical protein